MLPRSGASDKISNLDKGENNVLRNRDSSGFTVAGWVRNVSHGGFPDPYPACARLSFICVSLFAWKNYDGLGALAEKLIRLDSRVRARLVSCRKRRKMNAGLSPEGCSLSIVTGPFSQPARGVMPRPWEIFCF